MMLKDAFRQARISAGLTQAAAAELLEVAVRTIEDWDAGRREGVALSLATKLLRLYTKQDRLPKWKRKA